MSSNGHTGAWSEEALFSLSELWLHGYDESTKKWAPYLKISTIEIGRRLGKSKNAVVGMARRRNLPPRPSPISHSDLPRDERIKERYRQKKYGGAHRVDAVSLPALASLRPVHAQVKRTLGEIFPGPGTVEFERRNRKLPTPRPEKLPPLLSNVPCCWPLGDPKAKDFRFCEVVPTELGKPYCDEHMKLAYVKTRERREDDVMDRLRITAKLEAAG